MRSAGEKLRFASGRMPWTLPGRRRDRRLVPDSDGVRCRDPVVELQDGLLGPVRAVLAPRYDACSPPLFRRGRIISVSSCCLQKIGEQSLETSVSVRAEALELRSNVISV